MQADQFTLLEWPELFCVSFFLDIMLTQKEHNDHLEWP